MDVFDNAVLISILRQDQPDAQELVAGKCRVEFDDVSFSYVADAPVLKGVSFSCQGGQSLALVGATGALRRKIRCMRLPCRPCRGHLHIGVALLNLLVSLCHSSTTVIKKHVDEV